MYLPVVKSMFSSERSATNAPSFFNTKTRYFWGIFINKLHELNGIVNLFINEVLLTMGEINTSSEKQHCDNKNFLHNVFI